MAQSMVCESKNILNPNHIAELDFQFIELVALGFRCLKRYLQNFEKYLDILNEVLGLNKVVFERNYSKLQATSLQHAKKDNFEITMNTDCDTQLIKQIAIGPSWRDGNLIFWLAFDKMNSLLNHPNLLLFNLGIHKNVIIWRVLILVIVALFVFQESSVNCFVSAFWWIVQDWLWIHDRGSLSSTLDSSHSF